MQADLETPVLGVRALVDNCNPGHLRKLALKSEFFLKGDSEEEHH